MILNYCQAGEQKHISCVFISDTRDHGAKEVYAFLHELNQMLFNVFPEREHTTYFSDGAASHFKQRKNLANLAMHQFDYKVTASWGFQGTSHGKVCYYSQLPSKNFIFDGTIVKP